MKISKDIFQPLPVNYTGTFANEPFKVKGETYEPALLKLFNISNVTTDAVMLTFRSDSTLELTFIDTSTRRTELYTGKFSSGGYYEIYFANNKKEIPPLIPVIFYSRTLDRIRLALTKEGDLIIDNKWFKGSSMLFVLAGGGGGRTQTFFRKVANLQ